MLLDDEEITSLFEFVLSVEDAFIAQEVKKAQLKKVEIRLNEWYREMCPHTNRGSFKYGCIECWLLLLKEMRQSIVDEVKE